MAGEPFSSVSDLLAVCTSSASEMIFINTSGYQGGQTLATTGSTPVAGKISSMWRWDAQPGCASQTPPTTAVVTTNSTAGALKQSTPASGKKKRLISLSAMCNVAGALIIYDRLVQHGGMSGTDTNAQTTNLPSGSTPALTRRTNGIGVEAWLEIYSQIGASGTTATVGYTDQGSNSSTSPTFSIGATGWREQDRLIPVPLESGDRGMLSVQNVHLAATTGTAGDFGVTLLYHLLTLPLSLIGVGNILSSFFFESGAIDLGTDSDACLALAWTASTTTTPTIIGHAFFAEK